MVFHFATKIVVRFSSFERRVIVLGSVVLAAVTFSVLWSFRETWLALLNRDVTLTGRTDIWRLVFLQWLQHPILGYGLEGFWGSPDSNNVYLALHWTVTSAHNGFLECLVELGAVGLFLAMAVLFLAMRWTWRILRHRDISSSMLPIYLILVEILMNTTGTILPLPNSSSWILYLIAACMLEQDYKSRETAPQRTVVMGLPNLVREPELA